MEKYIPNIWLDDKLLFLNDLLCCKIKVNEK